MAQARSLVDLARNHEPEERAKLYGRVADLFQVAAETANDNERALLLEIMRALSAQVDVNLRLALAHRIADHPGADHDLILLLAHDRIEVASPIILKSVALTERDLIDIIRHCSVDHCTAVARRPQIQEPVCDALADTEIPDVMRALAANASARIGMMTLERLAQASRDDKTLLTNLLSRRQLPQSIAVRVYAWASSALRQHILENYDIDPKILDQELAQAVSSELSRDFNDPHTKRLQDLVEKLKQSGQLKPGFLLKALREGQIDLFRLAFARLVDMSPDRMAKILADGDLRLLALAVRAVGIDRSAFPTILNGLYGADTLDSLGAAQRALVLDSLAIASQDAARVRLIAAISA